MYLVSSWSIFQRTCFNSLKAALIQFVAVLVFAAAENPGGINKTLEICCMFAHELKRHPIISALCLSGGRFLRRCLCSRAAGNMRWKSFEATNCFEEIRKSLTVSGDLKSSKQEEVEIMEGRTMDQQNTRGGLSWIYWIPRTQGDSRRPGGERKCQVNKSNLMELYSLKVFFASCQVERRWNGLNRHSLPSFKVRINSD